METAALPTLKPYLVTGVSDDIRDVRKGDTKAQQTVLSGFAVKDIFAGDTVDRESNAADRKYFTEDGLIDFDTLVEPGCRHIPALLAYNGPKYATHDSTEAGNKVGGFLYTFAVLGGGELVWGNGEGALPRGQANGGYSYSPSSEAVVRRKDGLQDGSMIRQVYWCHFDDHTITDAYTRIGHYIKASDKYEFGDWALLSGEMMYIVVTDPTQAEVVNPLVNAIYSVHTTISNFIMPDASDLKYGTKITILQYPDVNQDDRAAWFTRVTYIDSELGEEFTQLCTPAPNRNTYREDQAYLEGLSPTAYTFEVVPVLDSEQNVIGRTWELQVDADETEFMVGLAEMLSAHTDPGVNEIVDYVTLKYSEENTAYTQSSRKTLVFNRSMPCSGYVSGIITKNSAALARKWTVVVKCVATNTDSNFVKINTTDTSASGYTVYPSQGVLYFNKNQVLESGVLRDVYQLAVDPSGNYEPGYLDYRVAFPQGKQFYTLNSSAEAKTICTVVAESLAEGQSVKFHSYLNRHNLLYVSIQPDPSQSHILVRDGRYADVQVGIVPDPHRGAYLSKQNLNPSAFTQFQFDRLKERNVFCTDIIDQDGHGATPEEVPASTQAVINAYQSIASKLQAKGLLTGVIDCGEMTHGELDNLTSTGLFRATPKDPQASELTGWLVIPDVNETNGWPAGVNVHELADIIVVGTTVAHGSATHEEFQYTATTDEVPNALTTYYTWNSAACEFELADGTGHPTVFDPVKEPYYVKTALSYMLTNDTIVQDGKDYYTFNSTTGAYARANLDVGAIIYQPNSRYYEQFSVGIRETTRVTQIVTQTSNGTNMWMRCKSGLDGQWSIWAKCASSKYFAVNTATNITAAAVVDAFARGEPTLDVGRLSTTSLVTIVNLPAANAIGRDRELTLNFIGSNTSAVLKIVHPQSTAANPAYQVNYSGSLNDRVTVRCKTDGINWFFNTSAWAIARHI